METKPTCFLFTDWPFHIQHIADFKLTFNDISVHVAKAWASSSF